MVEPVVIAMSSVFTPFPSGVQLAGPAPRKTVEYGTGIVVSEEGVIVADCQVTDGCLSIVIAGFGMPIASPRTRNMISRCCASTARAA